MARRRWLPTRRRADPPPPPAAGALPQSQDQLRRLHGLPSRRPRLVTSPWPQAAPASPPAVLKARRVLPAWLRHRSAAQPPWAVPAPTAQALPPQPARHRTLAAAFRRRASAAAPTALPLVPQDDVLRIRARPMPSVRRLRLVQTPSTPLAPLAPAYPIQARRVLRPVALLRRHPKADTTPIPQPLPQDDALRIRTRPLPSRRARLVQPPSVAVPITPAYPMQVRRLPRPSALLRHRPQVVPSLPPPPGPEDNALRAVRSKLAALRRGRVASPVPAPIALAAAYPLQQRRLPRPTPILRRHPGLVSTAPANPGPQDDVLRARVKPLPTIRRGRLVQPPVAPALPVVPAYPVQTAHQRRTTLIPRRRQPVAHLATNGKAHQDQSRPKLRLLPPRRARLVQPPWAAPVAATSAAPPVNVRAARRIAATRRAGRNIEPPWQVAIAAPPLVFKQPRARHLGTAAGRRRPVVVPPVAAKSYQDVAQRTRPKLPPARHRATATAMPWTQQSVLQQPRIRVKAVAVKRPKVTHPAWAQVIVTPNPPRTFNPSQPMRPRGLLRRHSLAQPPWAVPLRLVGEVAAELAARRTTADLPPQTGPTAVLFARRAGAPLAEQDPLVQATLAPQSTTARLGGQ